MQCDLNVYYIHQVTFRKGMELMAALGLIFPLKQGCVWNKRQPLLPVFVQLK